MPSAQPDPSVHPRPRCASPPHAHPRPHRAASTAPHRAASTAPHHAALRGERRSRPLRMRGPAPTAPRSPAPRSQRRAQPRAATAAPSGECSPSDERSPQRRSRPRHGYPLRPTRGHRGRSPRDPAPLPFSRCRRAGRRDHIALPAHRSGGTRAGRALVYAPRPPYSPINRTRCVKHRHYGCGRWGRAGRLHIPVC
ncbi:hypothetical protein PLICRDRAFT_180709 [Plicaturopsis crispa FD-325 SS-3]|uniref:Uncharacterized protein n=1 Tax=Plicaturopsis crispa FD-325 SS-3 TaxID=944288 RepID=A0A0C9T4P8_PLICR|nr:hypothetical protein PLICRDRAFT_180709 [Plicaturopsis crispa FD-325 SS-3]